jgi:hypothetical protein
MSKLGWLSWIRSRYVSSPSGLYPGRLENLLPLFPALVHVGGELGRPTTLGRDHVSGA